MKISTLRNDRKPKLMIIPMIDIIFFLLVFFMMSTLYMVEQKSLPVKLPEARNAAVDMTNNFVVTMKKDGTLYLEDKQAEFGSLLRQAQAESKAKPSMAIIIAGKKPTCR